jgi:hypothetical protein
MGAIGAREATVLMRPVSGKGGYVAGKSALMRTILLLPATGAMRLRITDALRRN